MAKFSVKFVDHGAFVDFDFPEEEKNGVCFWWVYKADFGAPRSVQGEDSTAVLSGTPLPHPSTAAPAHPPYPRVPVAPVQPASAHSAASLDPRCSVGRLARFRQEGGLVYLPYMRDSIERDIRIRNSLTRYMIPAGLDGFSGKAEDAQDRVRDRVLRCRLLPDAGGVPQLYS